VARLLAASQRPVLDAALAEASGTPLWKVVPTWFVYGTSDKNIPLAAHKFMANRASSRRTLEIPGASHVVMMSHAREVARIIEAASTP
jgi:pimeloyl-ACP methyl ester carboxylesterase